VPVPYKHQKIYNTFNDKCCQLYEDSTFPFLVAKVDKEWTGAIPMSENHNICIVCAWRETCQKKFSLSGRDIKCAEFVRDVSLKEDKPEPQDADKES